MGDKIINKYLIALKRNNIPITRLSVWEKDLAKTHMKISMFLGEHPMFTSVLFDRYVLKRNPDEFEYWSIWGYNQSFKGEKLSQGKAVNFLLAQNTRALK